MSSDNKNNQKEPKLTDAIKKIFTAGVSGALLSEDILKSYLSEVKLPKEIIQALLAGAQKSKDEITLRVSREVTQMIGKIDWVKVGSQFLENHKVKIKMELEFEKKEPLKKQK